MAYCGNCGGQVTEGHRFCATCGRPLPGGVPPPQASPPPLPHQGPAESLQAKPQSQAPWQPQPPPSAAALGPPDDPATAQFSARRSRRRTGRGAVVLAAGALVVLVVVGVAVAFTALRGGNAEASSFAGVTGPLVSAVSRQPQKAWEWTAPQDATPVSVETVGDDTWVVWSSSDGTQVTALDGKGEELWTEEVESGSGYLWSNAEHDVVLASGGEGGISAFSPQDGEELWTADVYSAVGFVDDGVLVVGFFDDQSEVALLDPASGDEIWSVDADDFYVVDDVIYTLVDEQLVKLAISDGEEAWSADVRVDAGEQGSLRLAAGSEVVLVAGVDEAVAYSSDDGGEVWSESLDNGAVEAGRFTDDVFWIYSSLDAVDSDSTASQLTFYDATGETDSIDYEDELYFSGMAISSGGQDYLLGYGVGVLIDHELEEIESFDDDASLTAVDDGVYALKEGDLSFQEYSGDEAWSIDVGEADTQFFAGESAVFAINGSEVERYE